MTRGKTMLFRGVAVGVVVALVAASRELRPGAAACGTP
jgi:hypothetical protein